MFPTPLSQNNRVLLFSGYVRHGCQAIVHDQVTGANDDARTGRSEEILEFELPVPTAAILARSRRAVGLGPLILAWAHANCGG